MDIIGRIRKIEHDDKSFEIVLEFPKTYVMEMRPVDPRMAFGPVEAVAVVKEWETISLHELINAPKK